MSNPHPTPFKKTGADANPNGRPKREWTWAGLLEKVGEEIETKSGQKFKDLVTKRLWVDAVNGSLGAQKEILNRMDGMPQQSVQLSGDSDNPVQVEVNTTLNKIYGQGNTPIPGEVHTDSL